MPHQLLGYDIDDVEGVLTSLSIMNEVAKAQNRQIQNPTNKSKQNPRRDRMNAKKPGYV
jgi:hypothetical protein